MWFPNQTDVIEIFAAHWESRHRSGAMRLAQERAASLAAKGDSDGHRLWVKVADRVGELRHPDRVKARRDAEFT